MKKSKALSLVLVTGLLGCHHARERNRLFLRTDTTGAYTAATAGYHRYYVFRPYGTYYARAYGGGGYVRKGYENTSVHTSEASVLRGGFGETGGFHVSS